VYSWPGNVRELQNVIERAVILSSGPELDPAALTLPQRGVDQPPSGPEGGATSLADAERRAILAALAATNWRISGRGGAAERLGLKPTTLHGKMKRLGITRPSTTTS